METSVKAIELKDVWGRYKGDGDERARERLVVAYSPLVKYVSGRMASGLPAHVEEADHISYGLGGLINAIERFELEREIKFETYAITRIKGSIIDELRSLDWVPRSVRARAREIEKANAKLEHQLQRAPSDEEMATELKISLDEFLDELEAIPGPGTVTWHPVRVLVREGDEAGARAALGDALERQPEVEEYVRQDAALGKLV